MTVDIRDATPANQHELLDCDLKCFSNNWQPEVWGQRGKTHNIQVAIVSGRIVGFVVHRYSMADKLLHVPKLGVKPDYRRQGIGTQLLASTVRYARRAGLTQLITDQPESIFLRTEAITWLVKHGWVATKLESDAFMEYGQAVDGVTFALDIPNPIQ